MKIPIIIAICFCLLIACEKENNDFPKTYIFDSFETGKVRIFTNNGELEYEQLSINFINNWSDYFYKKDSFRFDDFDVSGKITLNINNRSVIHDSDTTIYYGFKLKDGIIYFESSDTSYSTSDLINMKDRRFKYGPITQTDIKQGPSFGFPPSPNYYYGYLPCIYAVDEDQIIKFPFTSFLEKNCIIDTSWSITGNCNIEAISNINNMFNESYLNKVDYNEQINSFYEIRDTIVIQENFIVFKKTIN